MKVIVEDLGVVSYKIAHEKQESLFQEAQLLKRTDKLPNNTLLLCEHQPVFTLGKSASDQHFLTTQENLGAEVHRIERGGDVTFHGLGQLVAYPILDLEQFNMGLRDYIHNLEQAVINTIKKYGLHGDRVSSASGVWLDVGTSHERKICAVGVKASRYITMHGLAFNINTDLSWFNKIVPCGIADKGVTSLQKELGELQDFNQVKQEFIKAFHQVFH